MSEPSPAFDHPTWADRLLNRVVVTLVRLGIGPTHMRELEVRGRTTGTLYSMPVDLLSEQGRLYLVAPRGRTQWVRNAEAGGEVALRRGARVARYRVLPLSPAEKPPVLKGVSRSLPARSAALLSRGGGLTGRGLRGDCRPVSGLRADLDHAPELTRTFVPA